MRTQAVRKWIGLAGILAVVCAGPLLLQGAPLPVKSVAKAPAPRARVRLGVAPKSVVTINNKPIKIDAKGTAVKSVRAIPPQNFEPANRRKSVAEFYQKELTGKVPDKKTLEKYRVGPYRSEFVWWAYRYWGLEDRAWWAWNNRAYFDEALWAEWMAEPKFKAYITEYQTDNKPQTAGFVPAQYASAAPETIYNDDYLEAIYNPVFVPPTIVVDGIPGPKLVNLLEDAPRTFGKANQTIKRVGLSVGSLQFLSVPSGIRETYQIRVKRDCDLYLFGPLKNPLNDAVGEDASKWTAQNNMITGDGIAAVYKKAVKANDVINVRGVEWSVASEQIEMLSPASERAKSTVAVAEAKLGAMVDSGGNLFDSDPVLKPTLVVAQGAVKGLCTNQLGNVDEDQLDLFYASMASTEDSCKTIATQSVDRKLIAQANIMLSNLRGIRRSFSTFDELRDPDDQTQTADLSEGATEAGTVQLLENGVTMVNGHRHIDLMRLIDLDKDKLGGDWILDQGVMHGVGTAAAAGALEFPYAPPEEYDFILEFDIEKTSDRVCPILCGPRHQFMWDITNKGWNGLGNVDKLRPGDAANPTYNKSEQIANGMTCKAVMQVRKDHVVCSLNGRECINYQTDFHNVAMVIYKGTVKPSHSNTLGLELFKTTTSLKSAEVVEVSGEGTMVHSPETGTSTDHSTRAEVPPADSKQGG